MTDLSSTIIPKSDQLNSDDLISGPRTVTITKVSADPSSAEQPIAVSFEGDNGKPYKPCKSMRRVMVQLWGSDGSKYPGRSMTLYRDPTVKWGGLEIGGIRISHMSHIDKTVTIALTASRASRKPFTVEPMAAKKESPIDEYAKQVKVALDGATDADDLQKWWSGGDEYRSSIGIPEKRLTAMQGAIDAKVTELKGN